MAPGSRLYSRAIIMGYKGAKNTQINHTSLLQIEGVATPADTQFYLGKRVAYVYTAQEAKAKVRGKATKTRVIWGRVMKKHGNSGVVKAKFRTNLPPKSIGGRVRVMLYPSNI